MTNETTTIGYLLPDRSARPEGTPLRLVVPCDTCQAFHWHGAGYVEDPTERPGTVTYRGSHCHRGNDYYAIQIQPEPFNRKWMTRGGRQSKAYRLEVAR